MQIKQGNNLIAGLRATNEIPPIQMHYEDRSKDKPSIEKTDDGIEMKVDEKDSYNFLS